MNIGENIKALREKSNLTQQELADKIEVSRGMVAQIERGSKIPTLILANAIAKALDCSLDEIILGN